ncbi:MAG: TetR/AcrR family transcriptional regulator [bacterium]|nr:TetR/AcrR family transcriptional regulator [bacterium]
MPRQSFKERERERREQEILKAAAILIRERGYNNVSMDDIAEEVGVSKPTLYQHFKSKDDMIATTMVHSMNHMHQYMNGLEIDSPRVKLERMVRHLMESNDEPDAMPVALVEPQIIHALNHHTEVVRKRDEIGAEIFALIEEGKAKGEIARDVPTPVIIGSMFALMTVVKPSEALGEKARMYYTERAEMVEGMMRFFMRGILPQ